MDGVGPIIQLAWWVDDLEAAALHWAHLGVGPFFVLPHIPLEEARHRGQLTHFDHSSAYGWAGGCMIELVQVHSNEPSAFHELLPASRPLLHHAARFAANLDQAVAAFDDRGHPLAMDCRLESGDRFCFIDCVDPLGHFIELYEQSPALAGFYALVERAAKGWAGSDPIRQLSLG